MEVTNKDRREAVERLGRLLDDGLYRCTPERVYEAILGMAWGVVDDADETYNVLKLMAMIAPQLPDGVEWPRFEDGEMVGFGDKIDGGHGRPVTSICFVRSATPVEIESTGTSRLFKRGERIKRPVVPDSWERLIGDAVAADDEGARGMCEALVLRAKALAGEDDE